MAPAAIVAATRLVMPGRRAFVSFDPKRTPTPKGTRMIKAVKFVSVFVTDQDAALDFYTQKLGFSIVTDQPMGPGARWIELRIPGADTGIVIAKPMMPDHRVGIVMNMAFAADDVQKTYEELAARG